MKIKNKLKIEELNIKRFYVDDIVELKCPHCGEVFDFDGYFSYPKIGIKDEQWFYCHKCDEDWKESFIIDIVITPLGVCKNEK